MAADQALAQEPRTRPLAEMSALVATWKRVGYRMPAILARIDFDYRAFVCGLGINMPEFLARRQQFLTKASTDPLDIMIRFFFFGEDTPTAQLETVFSTAELRSLEAMNLVTPGARAGELVCPVGFYEVSGLFVVTDKELLPRAGISRVCPLLPEIYEFTTATVHRGSGRALDLGTGSGVHALVASKHYDSVVGIDITSRAVAFANFNKALNGLDNVEFRLGDLYDGVNQRFDLITFAPPYGPTESAGTHPIEASGGPRGDVVYARAIEGLNEHLTDGGIGQFCTIMIEWEDERFDQRVVRAIGADKIDQFDIVILSNPFVFRPELTGRPWAFDLLAPFMQEFMRTKKEYGVLSIRRGGGSRGRYVRGSFTPPPVVPISKIFEAMVAELPQLPGDARQMPSLMSLRS